jgi:hypothetical protein
MEILSFCFFGAMWSAFGAFFLPLLDLRILRDPRVIVLEGNLAKVNKILVKDPWCSDFGQFVDYESWQRYSKSRDYYLDRRDHRVTTPVLFSIFSWFGVIALIFLLVKKITTTSQILHPKIVQLFTNSNLTKDEVMALMSFQENENREMSVFFKNDENTEIQKPKRDEKQKTSRKDRPEEQAASRTTTEEIQKNTHSKQSEKWTNAIRIRTFKTLGKLEDEIKAMLSTSVDDRTDRELKSLISRLVSLKKVVYECEPIRLDEINSEIKEIREVLRSRHKQ